MILGIDIDNTLCDTHEMIWACAQKYGAEANRPPFLDRSRYFLSEYLGWPEEVVEAFRQRCLRDIYRDVRVKAGAAAAMQSLHQRHSIILVTGRNSDYEGMEEVTRQWLQRLQIPFERLVMNATPHMHHFSKKAVVEEAGIELMVEDHPDLCLELAPLMPVLMFDQPYNQEVNAPGIARVSSWQQIEGLIETIAGERHQLKGERA